MTSTPHDADIAHPRMAIAVSNRAVANGNLPFAERLRCVCVTSGQAEHGRTGSQIAWASSVNAAVTHNAGRVSSPSS
jgi:hypothetical protein